MEKTRTYTLRDGVMFDENNLIETAGYCLDRNHYLQGLAKSTAEARDSIMTMVLDRIASKQFQLGQMAAVYNAWFVVDPFSPETNVGTLSGIDDPSEIRFEVSLFVRPGREVISRDATEILRS